MININHIATLEEKTTFLKEALSELDKTNNDWKTQSKALQIKCKERSQEKEDLEQRLREVMKENEKIKKEK